LTRQTTSAMLIPFGNISFSVPWFLLFREESRKKEKKTCWSKTYLRQVSILSMCCSVCVRCPQNITPKIISLLHLKRKSLHSLALDDDTGSITLWKRTT
jgi:hypothetical protein